MPVITALYAGILGLMSIPIAFAAGSLRGKTKISIGDGGNTEMLLAMRRHANFIEFVPLALLLIALIELNGAPALAIHALALCSWSRGHATRSGSRPTPSRARVAPSAPPAAPW